MKLQRILTFLFVLVACNSVFAQPYSWMGRKAPYKWAFGIGWNAVDDDGRDVCQPFDVKESWNMPAFPTRIVVDRYLKKGLSVEFAGAYNQYQSDKLINDTTGLSGLFISTDLNCKYSFYQLLDIYWLDPYASLGIGGTHREVFENPFKGTLNVSLGVNFWITNRWGIQLQSSGKLGISGDFFSGNTDYIQHTASIMYRIPQKQYKGTFHKKQHKWTSQKPKYRSGRRRTA
jgi:hypothetical protein